MHHPNRLPRTRMLCRAGASAALALAGVLSAGCNGDEARDAFRSAAATGLQGAVSSFFGALGDGATAVLDLAADNAADTGTSATPTDNAGT